MILPNNFKIIFFISLLTLFISCEKETVTPIPTPSVEPFDKSLYGGMFYCDITKESGLNGTFNDSHYDQIIKVSIENDSIKFLNFKVPIDSLGQTEFDLGHNNPNDPLSYRRTFQYTNNFEGISYSYRASGYYSNSENHQINGSRSLLTETPDETPDSLKGDYLLTIRNKNFVTNSDTQYVAVRYVTRDSERILIDGDHIYSSPSFHSFFENEQRSYYGSFYSGRNISINWTPSNFSCVIEYPDQSNTIEETREYIGPRN